MVEILGGHKERYLAKFRCVSINFFLGKKVWWTTGQCPGLLQLSTRPGIRFTKMALIGSGPRLLAMTGIAY